MIQCGLIQCSSQESGRSELDDQLISQKSISLQSAVESLNTSGSQLDESERWQQIWNFRTQYLQSLQDTQEILENEKHKTLHHFSRKEEQLNLNPWDSIHQPSSFFPELGSLSFWSGQSAQTPMPKEAALAIPALYRLAEALGMGANQVYLKISLEDGQLFTSTLYGFHIASRLRFGLIGEFHLPQGAPIQTFHHSILSRGRINTQEIHLGPEVKPHQIQLKRFQVEELPRINRDTLWKLERLDLKYPTHFQSIEMSPEAKNQQADSEQKLKQAMEQKFKLIRNSIIDSQLEALQNQNIFSILDHSFDQFTEWESKHSEDPACPMQLKSKHLINSASLKSNVQSQANSTTPYLLDSDALQHQENLINAALAHGLYHRTPSEERQQALLLYLKFLEGLSWAK